MDKIIETKDKQNEQNIDTNIIQQFTALNNELLDTKRQLIKSNLELQKLNQLKNQFINIASHDLRSPLGAIRYFSQTLAEELNGIIKPEDIALLQIVTEQSNYMLKLIENLLNYTKIEDHDIKFDFCDTDLNDLVENNVKMNSLIANQKNIKIAFEPWDGTLIVHIDKDYFQLVLNNLLSNAIKFSHLNTTIVVRTWLASNSVNISIHDQGMGILPDDLNRIFEPYNKGKNKPTGKESSTGLGLSIVKGIIERHNGNITVESTPEAGSKFTISLPAHRISIQN